MNEWLWHRLIGHALSRCVRSVGFGRAASWLHDRTLPPHRNHIWDID